MASLRARVRNHCKKITIWFCRVLRDIVAVAHDHVKLWEFGLTLTLKIPSALFIAPFTVTSTKDGPRKLRIRSSRPSNWISWMLNIIVGIRLACYTSNCLDLNFKWIAEGKFTADAVAFTVGFILAGATYLHHLVLLYYKEDFVFLCNSAIKLNKRFSEKHLGTSNVMYMTSSKLVVVLCIAAGGLSSSVPFTMALVVNILRWSPAMLPYHVFGDQHKLMELEMNNSMAYWSVLLLDWGACTIGALASYCAVVIYAEALLSITLISRALRSPEARNLNWNTKRFYHVQLEILMNTLQRVLGKLTPLLVQGSSLLSGMSTVMVLHFDPFKDGQACGYCAFTFFLGVILYTWLGAFGIFLLMEQVMEESEAVLKDIEKEILAQPIISICFYHGGQLAKSRFLARSFRRRLLRMKVGDFRTIEPGFALEYFQMAAENIVTYAFMVDPASQMWLF